MRSCEKFRKLIQEEPLIQIPGAYDCITAKMIEKAGFPALYLTGSGMSLTLSGLPDLNTISYLEVRQIVENVRNAVDIPMLVDIDTGFGAPLNIYRLVKEFERLDVAAVQIEDQKTPKKCGHELGRETVSTEEMVKRIRTIYENREKDGLVIVARTDARTSLGLDEAIKRGNTYLEAGADVVFVESPESLDEVKRITEEVNGPVLFNNVEGGRSPFLTIDELKSAGVKISIYPNTLTRIILKNCGELLQELKEAGTTEKLWNRMLDHKEVWATFNHAEWVEIERKYS